MALDEREMTVRAPEPHRVKAPGTETAQLREEMGRVTRTNGVGVAGRDNVSKSGVKEVLTEEAIRCIHVGITKHTHEGGNRWVVNPINWTVC